MAESFDPTALPAAKAARYAALAEEVAAVLEGEGNIVALQATVVSMLANAFEHYFWTGFYLVDPAKPEELVIGPYHGTLGCAGSPSGAVCVERPPPSAAPSSSPTSMLSPVTSPAILAPAARSSSP